MYKSAFISLIASVTRFLVKFPAIMYLPFFSLYFLKLLRLMGSIMWHHYHNTSAGMEYLVMSSLWKFCGKSFSGMYLPSSVKWIQNLGYCVAAITQMYAFALMYLFGILFSLRSQSCLSVSFNIWWLKDQYISTPVNFRRKGDKK